jgi:hypothetical protein
MEVSCHLRTPAALCPEEWPSPQDPLDRKCWIHRVSACSYIIWVVLDVTNRFHENVNNIVAYLLKARTVKSAETPAARERFTSTPVGRQKLRNTQQWSNWETVFSTRCLPIATGCDNRRNVGRGVFYEVHANSGTAAERCQPVRQEPFSRKPRTPPSGTMNTVTENIILCEWSVKCSHELCV